MTARVSAQNSTLKWSGVSAPRHGPGMPEMPSVPLVSQISLLAISRITSANPRVTIAR